MKKKPETTPPAPAAKTIGAEDLARVPFGAPSAERGGAAAAESELPKEEPASEPSAAQALPSDGSGALALVEMALGLSVAFMASKAKLPAAQVEDLRRLGEDERALLRTFAPAAEPYLGVLAGNSPQIGAAIFAAAFGLIAVNRFAELRERARANKAAAPKSAPAERSAELHGAVFGPAAANVPRSTRIEDVGFPPPFTPSSEPPQFQQPFTVPANASPDPLVPIA